MTSPELTLAVCLFDNVDALDYQGPIDLFGFIDSVNNPGGIDPPPPYNINVCYIANTMNSVKPAFGPRILPDDTYSSLMASKQQFDILLVPGGPGARPGQYPDDVLEFIKSQATNAKYVLSVCTGAWILAYSGVLDGKKATTNKKAFKSCRDDTKEHRIQWIAPARWINHGNIWTSSGVAAGIDMAAAFLNELVGENCTTQIRNIVEVSKRDQFDDEFAYVWGDVDE